MPELAEVDYLRKQWNPGLGEKIESVRLNRKARVFAGCDLALLERTLTGGRLLRSESAGKQMLFHTSGNGWLGIHLGMTGELSVERTGYLPGKSDHLILITHRHLLVFRDFRMFGRIRFAVGASPPDWWSSIAPPILSRAFTVLAVVSFLQRRARTPIKAVLLMQERFPGVGNWMADEILWRAAIHPRRPAGTLTESEIRDLHRETKWVCRQALKIIGERFGDPPKTWLFPHRWESGGRCPRTGVTLVREEIGGRTTCWSPGRQKLK